MSSISAVSSSNSSTKSSNTIRITGLATGLDVDEMVKTMLSNEQTKVDKAKQKQQTLEWQQTEYRDIIKNIKGLRDKYFGSTSSSSILNRKAYSTMNLSSTNDSIMTATAGGGAEKINYKFKVTQLADVAKVSTGKIDKDKQMKDLLPDIFPDASDENATTTIKINDKEITVKATDKITDLVTNINKTCTNGDVKAVYSEMTGKFTIESTATGENAEIKLEGALFDSKVNTFGTDGNVNGSTNLFTGLGTKGVDGYTVKGENSKMEVYDTNGTTLINTIEKQTNSFTIDNITYNLNSESDELVSMNCKTDTTQAVKNMQDFLDEYNKMMDDIYTQVTQKKDSDYQPLTDEQKEEMTDEEIEKWEEKAKQGILRNDTELRKFMNDIKEAVFGKDESTGLSLKDIGIVSVDDYNKPGQLQINTTDSKYAKFEDMLKQNGDMVYKVATSIFDKVEDVTYNYAGSSGGILVEKSGIANSSTASDNIFSEQIRDQETRIQELLDKMSDKEDKLYDKFANLESVMSTMNSQMSYLSSLFSS